jgi:NADPH:quinone reductase-like Zn-dependent oxidoreductase
MKAAFYTGYGAAREVLEIGELPDPQPGPGEVRVRVRFSGINPSDCNRRLGIRDRPGQCARHRRRRRGPILRRAVREARRGAHAHRDGQQRREGPHGGERRRGGSDQLPHRGCRRAPHGGNRRSRRRHISEVDFGGNLTTTLAVMKVGCAIGAYASKGAPEPAVPFYPLLFNNVVVRFIQCYAMPDDIRERAHADVARWSAQGTLKHLPTKIMPLEEVAAAHELVEQSGFIGKVMLRL